MFTSKKTIAAKVAARLNGDTASATMQAAPKRWYEKEIFPLKPTYGSRQGNEHNSYAWWFHWTFFKFWSMDSFEFAVEFHIDGHWGIGFVGNVPYVRWVACIPCPPFIQSWMIQKLWRNVKKF